MKSEENEKDLVETKRSGKSVYDGSLLHVICDTVTLPNGKTAIREWIKHPGASAVVPFLPDGSIILVRQYRYPIEAVTLEIPAGKLDAPDEDPMDCARRELSEETGYDAGHLEKLVTTATTVGFSNERIHIYLAEEMTAGKQHTDADEFINVVRMPLKKAVELVKDGSICDAKSMVGVLLLWEREQAKK